MFKIIIAYIVFGALLVSGIYYMEKDYENALLKCLQKQSMETCKNELK